MGAVCPAQTRQNNDILQEQPEVTALKWFDDLQGYVPRGKQIFFSIDEEPYLVLEGEL